MAQLFYRRVVKGYVEQVYDVLGNCVSQEFHPLTNEVERRYIAPTTLDGDGNEVEAVDGDLEDDELIEHAEDIETIEQIEKFWDYEMVQPKAANSSRK